MATTTPRLGLHMPADDGSEPINVATDINDNLEKIDGSVGFVPSTSSTPPATYFDGMATYETDTGRAKFRKALAGAWNYLMTAGSTFLSDIWLGTGYRFGIGTTTPEANIDVVVDNVLTNPNVLKFRQTGHSNPVLQIDRDGIKIGEGGSSDTDTRIYRPAANQIAIVGSVSMNAGLDVTGTTAVDDLNISNDLNVGGDVTGNLNILGDLSVGGIGKTDVRVRTTDLSRANSTTAVADTAFDYFLEGNSTYLVEMFCMVGGDPNADFRTTWTVPAGATGPRYALAAASASGSVSSASMITVVVAFSAAIISGVQSTTVYAGHQELLVVTTVGFAGTMQFNWAQGTSSATATTLKAGSIMRVRKVA
jgi:hypothetical protein